MNFFYKSLQYLSISGVKFYRKFISPYKGFSCGYSHYTGGLSCSTYGLKQLQSQNNPLEALRLISHRLKACSHVTYLFKEDIAIRYSSINKQSGFIDCGGCDTPDCDVTDICDCDFNRKNKNSISNNLITSKNESMLKQDSTTKVSL